MGNDATELSTLERYNLEKDKFKIKAEVISSDISENTDTSIVMDPDAAAADEGTPDENTDSLEKDKDAGLMSDTPNQPVDHDYKKRFDDSQSYITELRAKAQETEESLRIQVQELKNKAALADVKSEEELLEFKNKYPEVYDNLFSIAKRTGLETEQKIAVQLKKVEEAQKSLERKENLLVVQEVHPDFKTIAKDSKFKEWKAVQPTGIQALLDSDDPDSIIAGLNIYKDAAGIKKATAKQQKKDEKLEATLDVDTSGVPAKKNFQGKKIWNESEAGAALRTAINRNDSEEYDRLLKDIESARLEGRFNPGV